jgi:hypothetical protein
VNYSSEDKYVVQLIERAFAVAGVQAWIDRSVLKGGQRFAAEIEAAILQSDAVVVLTSASAAQSDWVRREVEHGVRNGKRIIPCRLDRTPLPSFVAEFHCVDFTTDLKGGLGALMASLNLPPAPESVFADSYKEILRRALSIKITGSNRGGARIPGIELRTPEEKLIRWKNCALPTSVGLVATSRDFLKSSYGHWLEDLFRGYIEEDGWNYSPIDSDHYGEMHYRTRTRCQKGNRALQYVFSAKRDAPSGDGDWDSELWLIDADHRFFFGQVLDWSRGLISADLLMSDDFIVAAPQPLKTTRTIELSGQSRAVSLCFYCSIGDNLSGLDWVEQLRPMFIEYLESIGYEVQSVGDAPPLFEIHTIDSIRRSGCEQYLFQANDRRGHLIEFYYESEWTGSRSQGYAKLSFLQ